MAIQHIKNVKIAGISAAVPRHVVETRNLPCFTTAEECERYMENVGVERVHQHTGGMTCSDMCQVAAEKLLGELQWDRKEIDLLVFLSQSQDYILPATSCVLQHKLGLADSCCCFDISLGCSGWVYGLSVVSGMMQTGHFKKAILLVGDALPAEYDKNAELLKKPLFGDAGTATFLEYDEAANEIVISTKTEGAGYEAIIRRSGGDRHPVNEHSLEQKEDQFGNIHREIDTEMDGAAVFIFGITKVPKAVKEMMKLTDKNVDDIDYFLFHQANLMMNEQIRKKCKIPAEKCPYSIRQYGNNSSASIPVAIVTQIREPLQTKEQDIIACGFGVGLSWGTLYTRLQKPVIPPLVEI